MKIKIKKEVDGKMSRYSAELSDTLVLGMSFENHDTEKDPGDWAIKAFKNSYCLWECLGRDDEMFNKTVDDSEKMKEITLLSAFTALQEQEFEYEII